MARQLFLCVLAFASMVGTINADPFYFVRPRQMFVQQPVVAYAPVVTYQPAYVVPTMTYSVSHVPVTTVSYSTSYYVPLVPMVATAPVIYARPMYVTPVLTPVYLAPVYGGHGVHSHLNVHRNGSYNYRLRVR